MHENKWFEGRNHCLTPLLAVLGRQTKLKFLAIHCNGLSLAQKERIQDVVVNHSTNCRVIFTLQEWEAFKGESSAKKDTTMLKASA